MSISLQDLTIEQKVGQLFLIGIDGPELSGSSLDLVREIEPGGVCLFARNISSRQQVRELNDSIREELTVTPILTLDEEGGLVDRLRRVMRPIPAASRNETPERTNAIGRIIGETLRILGFNMDLAPVVDVIHDGRRSFDNGLASRTYGNSVSDVVSHANAFLDGLNEFGILGCIKHFPGLGASQVDSHEELPSVDMDDIEFDRVDVEPFRSLISKRDCSVMVGHAAYPKTSHAAIDTDGRSLPATLNPNIVGGLLRDELRFDGLVITDDLEMGAIIRNYGIGEACTMALLAGVDMLAICADGSNIRSGYAAVLDSVRSGSISMNTIDRAAERVLRTRSHIASPFEFDNVRLDEICRSIEELS